MAAGTYLDLVSGTITRKTSVEASAGAADEGKLVALNASGQIDGTMLAGGVFTANVGTGPVANGDLVYITPAGLVEPAVATAAASLAMGYCLVGAASPNPVTVYFSGENTAVSALSPGVPYYLSATTAGAVTSTPPATPTNYVQAVGFTLSATDLHFAPTVAVVV